MKKTPKQYEILSKRIQNILSSIGHEIGFPLPPTAFKVTWNDPKLEKDFLHFEGLGKHRLYIDASPSIHYELGTLMLQFVPVLFEEELKAVALQHNIPFYFDTEVELYLASANEISDWMRALDLLEKTLPKNKQIISRS